MRTLQDILRKTRYKETEIEYFLTECYSDYIYFAEHVLGFDIANYHKEWFDYLEKWPRLCLISFRGSGKTAFLSGYYIWNAIFREKLNFLIISNSFEQSKHVLKLIRTMIMDNDLLKEFAPLGRKDTTWKATELSLKNGSTFYCKTYGENTRGLRIDYLLCDEAGQYEDKSLFWTAICPVVQLNMGKICVIGTKQSPTDLLSELENNSEYWSMEYPAEKDGKVLWEDKYTLLEHDTETKRSLKQIRKEIGELPYTQEYLLIPISAANSLFPYQLTSQGLVDTMKFLPYGRANKKYYLGYDMAVSPKGDYTVITILEVDSDKKTIVKAVRFRDTFEEQKRIVRQLMSDFPIKKGFVDATAIGDQQAKEIHQEFPQIEPKKMTYDDKYGMMIDLRNEFDKYNIVIPNNKDDMNAYSYAQELLKELNEFALKIDTRIGQSTRPKFVKGKYDDCVDSLALANKASEELYGDVSVRGIE
jgi:phage terminase large subunit-like protein